jgi:NhaP-type Na+/H+ or K+/H+ antiporter
MLAVDQYDLALAVLGLALLGAAVVPRLLAERPLSLPIVYLGLGFAFFALPLGLPDPDPIGNGAAAERLTEVTVIISLMGVGLKLDRPMGWRSWSPTWRLLGITMPLSIAAVALLGWWAGLLPATALLVGAVLAPTDPVLASDVQVAPPGEGDAGDTRFTLTSEAGLNDALAFPFTNAALAAAGAGSAAWIGGWVVEDVVVKLAVGLLVGVASGLALGGLAFRIPGEGSLAKSAEGFVAVAATLLTYGVAELAHGYGFLAVFVAAVTLRAAERDHEYHGVLHGFTDAVEQLFTVVLLVLVGGAVASGALAALTPGLAAGGLASILLVRPLFGWLGLLGTGLDRADRAAIAFFGIRGMGSLYYAAYAAQEAEIPGMDAVWALTIFVVVVSVVVHGVASTPVMLWMDRRRQQVSPVS